MRKLKRTSRECHGKHSAILIGAFNHWHGEAPGRSFVLKAQRERFFVAKQTLARVELCTNVELLLLASAVRLERIKCINKIKTRTCI
jgi:hypothetical protein